MRVTMSWAAVALGVALGGLSTRGLAAAPSSVKEAPAFHAPRTPIHVVTDEEAAVYGAFIEQAYDKTPDDGANARAQVLIENEALDDYQPNRRAWEKMLLKRTGGQGRVSEEARQAFLTRPRQILRLYKFPSVRVTVRMVRTDVLAAAFAKGGWKAFYEDYPKVQGVLTLSVMGFAPQRGEAVFAARMRCGKRCAFRDLITMRKVNGEWLLMMKEPLP